MKMPRLPDQNQPAWDNAQLEQLSLLLAAASRMAGASLPSTLLASTAFVGAPSGLPPTQTADDVGQRVESSLQLPPSHTPDGKTAMRYPEPDVKALVYDPAVGYRFDPSTGLHYDANTGLFVNKELGVLLRYEKLTNTYERVGNTGDINAPVLAKELATLLGYDTSHTATLAGEAPSRIVTPPPPSPPLAPPPPCLSPSGAVWSGEKSRRKSYDEMSSSTHSPFPREDPSRSPRREMVGESSSKYTPSPPRAPQWSPGPGRERSSSRGDRISSRTTDRVLRRSSSTETSTHQKRPKQYRSRSRSRSSISPPRKSRKKRDKSRRRSKDEEKNIDDVQFKEAIASIAKIHEHNLKDPGNALSRFLPPTFKFTEKSELQVIMVTPLPPKGNREWADLEVLFKGILRANGVSYDSVSVQPQDGNAPCDHIVIRFKKPQHATRWYLLHEGALDLANPDGSKCTAYMYFSKPPWKCGFCPTTNFPLRFFCFRCLKPREIQTRKGAVVPITEFTHLHDIRTGSKWVGIKNLDHRITSIHGVLDTLPPLNSFGIKTCEYMTEENGLPLGWCIFEMNDRTSAKEFHEFLRKKSFNPVFLLVNSRKGLGENAYPLSKIASNSRLTKPDKSTKSKRHEGSQTLVSLVTNVRLADYILQSQKVEADKPNQKGTQTLLVYKHL